MSGLGRRTHYRKHLTDKVLNDYPVPAEDESIAKVVATRGGNQFDIILPGGSDEQQLAILPTKFRKLVWLKRNDFVIVQTAKDDLTGDTEENQDAVKTEETGSIRFMISHILYKDQVKHLKSEGYWPEDDPRFNDASADHEAGQAVAAAEDGIVYEAEIDSSDEDVDRDLFVNTNRIATLAVDDSSSESDEDGD